MKPRSYQPLPQPLSLAAQSCGLRATFPQGRVQRSRLSLRWEGLLSPLESSRTYQVRLDYSLGEPPHVYVLTPDFKELAPGRRLPHIYDAATQRLCLYLPGIGLWTPRRSLAKTVMKWALAWLTFFELWIVTDVWYGRGFGHPGDDPSARTD